MAKQVVPVSETELLPLIAAGVVTKQTLIWRAGFTSWTPAGGIEGFFRPPQLPKKPAEPDKSPANATVPPCQAGETRAKPKIPPTITKVPKQCPKCGLVSPVDAQTCDRGFSFATEISGKPATISWKPLAFALGVHRAAIGRSIGQMLGRSVAANANSAEGMPVRLVSPLESARSWEYSWWEA